MRQPAAAATEDRAKVLRSPRRLLFAAGGVVCVGLGAVGVFVPGLPTTVFLIAASYLFTRSCPWLEDRLIRTALFRPFLGYLDGKAVMPVRAKVVTLLLMWVCVGTSVWMLAGRFGLLHWAPITPPVAALTGSWFIVRQGRGRERRAPTLRAE